MNIFLTGASGLLGHAIAKHLIAQGHSVHAATHKTNVSFPELIPHKVDLSRTDQVENTLSKVQPEAIINAAALSIPFHCEENPTLSQALNKDLPIQLALIAANLKSRCIHFSTDMVFDGKQGSYSEADAPRPTNIYGEHKLASENRIRENAPETVIVRLPLLMGNSPSRTRSVHEAHWQHWKVQRVTPLIEDELRTPVSVSNVAALAAKLLKKKHIQGLFHWGGATALSRWDMGQLIARKLGIPLNLLIKTQAKNDPRFKDRPLNLTLNVSLLSKLVTTRPPSFEEQLKGIETP